MGATYNQRVAFCYYLFDTYETAELRLAYVKEVAKRANEVSFGGVIAATSGNGTSVQFQLPSEWSNDDILGLTNEARAWAACADVTTALALVGNGPVTSFGHDFSAMGAGGVL